jgi:hypothetical protein
MDGNKNKEIILPLVCIFLSRILALSLSEGRPHVIDIFLLVPTNKLSEGKISEQGAVVLHRWRIQRHMVRRGLIACSVEPDCYTNTSVATLDFPACLDSQSC